MRIINHQSRRLLISLVAFSCITLIGTSIQAQPANAPEARISATINILRDTITSNQRSYQQDPQLLYDKVGITVKASFNTARFAKGVMGKHFSNASPAQIKKFNQALESSLVTTLTDGLVGIGDFQAATQKATIKSSATGNKARVLVKVTTPSKNNHDLKFSMIEENGNWMIYNAVFDGVDLGKSFRSQFGNALATKGNIDQVVSDWQIITQ